MTAGERRLAPSASREAQLRALQARKPLAPQASPVVAKPKAAAFAQPPVDVSEPAYVYEPNYGATAQAMVEADEIESILENMRAALKKRTADVDGVSGIKGLGRNFRIADTNKNGVLDVDEFAKCVALCKLGLNSAQVAKLHAHFDRDGSGLVDYDEFLRAVRGPLPPSRRKIVLQAFHALDALGDGNGVLTVEGARRHRPRAPSPLPPPPARARTGSGRRRRGAPARRQALRRPPRRPSSLAHRRSSRGGARGGRARARSQTSRRTTTRRSTPTSRRGASTRRRRCATFSTASRARAATATAW